MRINITAQLKDKDEFFKIYQEGDEKVLYNGKSLLHFALSNNDPSSRYEISVFLLDKGTEAKTLNEEHQSCLHALLGSHKHILTQTIELCRRLIEEGVDINILDDRKILALQWIINMTFSDDELEPLYDLWFSQPYVDCTTKNFRGYSPMDLAGKISNRAKLYERMKRYVETIR